MVARTLLSALLSLALVTPALAQDEEESEDTDTTESSEEEPPAEEAPADISEEAPPEEEAPPVAEDPPPPELFPAPEDDGYKAVVGLQVGPTFALSPLMAHVMPRLEAGVEPPWLGRRLRIWASVSHTRPATEGELVDDRVTDADWSYRLTQSEWLLGLGLTGRLTDPGWRVVPEATVGPTLYLLRTRTHGDAAGSDFNENREVFTRGGIYSALGASMELGPGEATLHVLLTSSGLNATLAGEETNSLAISPLLGYRILL